MPGPPKSGPVPLPGIGGMDVAIRRHAATQPESGSGDFHDIFRLGANLWGFAAGDFWGRPTNAAALTAIARTAIRAHMAEISLPSAVLDKLNIDQFHEDPDEEDFQLCSVVCARLELDASGAWVTLACAGYPRPTVVRQAGWIDIRGHVAAPLGAFRGTAAGDDRVGLGPGDALIICSDGIVGSRDSTGDAFGEESLPHVLLDCVGQPATDIAERVVSASLEFAGGSLSDDGIVLVVRVPEIPKSGALARVSEATGIPIDELDLPGYPASDVQPDMWRHRPEPPREARMRLAPEPPSIPALRRLLRRLLQSWRMQELRLADIELLATELATSAFTRTSSEVTVIVRYAGDVLRVEVSDGAEVLRRRRGWRHEDLSRHGLLLVEALSSAWGVNSTGTTTRVWFEVPAFVPDKSDTGF